MMFKLFSPPREKEIPLLPIPACPKLGSLLAVLPLLLVAACRSLPAMPPVNFHDPGWVVKEGQAIWKRDRKSAEMAGEILLATNRSGAEFVQFTKEPFPMVIAQRSHQIWQIEFPMKGKRYTGKGRPPERLIWAYLPGLLSGTPPPGKWSWKQLPERSWRLENSVTGEVLEGYFNQ